MTDHFLARGSAASVGWRCLAGPAVLSLALAGMPVRSHPLPLGFTSASSGWETSIDQGSTWTSNAYAGYPNHSSTPYHVWPDGTVRASLADQLMWFWNQATPPSGINGPNEVRFRRWLSAPSPDLVYRIYLAADDYLEVYLDGQRVADYLLDRDMAADGQPGLLSLDIAGQVLATNPMLEIIARDGGPQPFDRLNEYIFVDSMHGEAASAALKFSTPGHVAGDNIGADNPVVRSVFVENVVPEPASLALSLLALAALAGCRRMPASRRGAAPTSKAAAAETAALA